MQTTLTGCGGCWQKALLKIYSNHEHDELGGLRIGILMYLRNWWLFPYAWVHKFDSHFGGHVPCHHAEWHENLSVSFMCLLWLRLWRQNLKSHYSSQTFMSAEVLEVKPQILSTLNTTKGKTNSNSFNFCHIIFQKAACNCPNLEVSKMLHIHTCHATEPWVDNLEMSSRWCTCHWLAE